MIGHEDLIEDFKKLANKERLSHAYLFFGEPQVGKFLFSQHLANFLENKLFELPISFLNETFFISPVDGTIGIDAVRSLKRFLYQKPVISKWRIAIIRDAENLTNEAQNAVLKILEEPPVQSLIIFIADNYDNLSSTILSRFQKIYFSRVSSGEIEKFLIKKYKINQDKAKKIIVESFGRPGRAIDLFENKNLGNIRKMAKEFLRIDNLRVRRRFIKEKFINKSSTYTHVGGKEDKFDDYIIDKFFEFLIIELCKDRIKNLNGLQEIFKRLTLIKQFNVNKKLQISALY
ncbi:MAG TPA: hypothetical protein ENH26_01165 [Candidatus Wolfebacteria bacterium]|nr:hypothetical protein [Candidatus Wolfebacteria bacterium]